MVCFSCFCDTYWKRKIRSHSRLFLKIWLTFSKWHLCSCMCFVAVEGESEGCFKRDREMWWKPRREGTRKANIDTTLNFLIDFFFSNALTFQQCEKSQIGVHSHVGISGVMERKGKEGSSPCLRWRWCVGWGSVLAHSIARSWLWKLLIRLSFWSNANTSLELLLSICVGRACCFWAMFFCPYDGCIALCSLLCSSSWKLNSQGWWLPLQMWRKCQEEEKKKSGKNRVFIPQCVVNVPLVIQVANSHPKLGLASVLV